MGSNGLLSNIFAQKMIIKNEHAGLECEIEVEPNLKYNGVISEGSYRWDLFGTYGQGLKVHRREQKRGDSQDTLLFELKEDTINKAEKGVLPKNLANLNSLSEELDKVLPHTDSRRRKDLDEFEEGKRKEFDPKYLTTAFQPRWFEKEPNGVTWTAVLDKDRESMKYWAEKKRKISVSHLEQIDG